jgi:hypothetical protein
VCEGTWEGNPTIVVGVVWSQNLARLAAIANRIGDKLPPKSPNSGRRLIEQVASDPIRLSQLFGVMRLVDESGDISLVAYGQASLGQVAPSMRAASLAAAFTKAEMEAKASLKDFVLVETDSEAQRQFAQLAQSSSHVASVQQQESFSQTLRQKSSELQMIGVGELRRWTGKIDGVDVAGVVIGWSPRRQVLAGRAGQPIVGGPEVRAKPAEGAPKPVDPNAPGTTTFDPTW